MYVYISRMRAEDLRLESDHIAYQLPLIALIIAHLAGPIEQLDTLHPLVDGELVLARKVVHMADQACHELAQTRRGVGTHRVDDIVRKVGVESVSRHGVV